MDGVDVNPNLVGVLARWDHARDCDAVKRSLELRTPGPTWKNKVESAVNEWEL